MAAQKISIYSLSDLKNTTDDALPNYLTSLKFKQSHFLTDVRLALGYSAVLIAAITFYADYKFGWDKTKAPTFWAVLVYFTLNGALTCWIWGMEKGEIFAGHIELPSKGRTLLSIASSVTKHTPVYNLSVRCNNFSKQNETFHLSSPFARWFDADGVFVAKPFHRWLATEITLIGQVDPQNRTQTLAPASKTTWESESTPPMQQNLHEAPTKSSPSGLIPGSTKSRKGKKT